MILDKSFDSVSNGDHIILLDKVGRVSLEEGVGGGGLISDHTVDHGNLLAVTGIDLLAIDRDYLHVDVVTATGRFDILYFDELGLGEDWFFTHIC